MKQQDEISFDKSSETATSWLLIHQYQMQQIKCMSSSHVCYCAYLSWLRSILVGSFVNSFCNKDLPMGCDIPNSVAYVALFEMVKHGFNEHLPLNIVMMY